MLRASQHIVAHVWLEWSGVWEWCCQHTGSNVQRGSNVQCKAAGPVPCCNEGGRYRTFRQATFQEAFSLHTCRVIAMGTT